MRSSAAREPTFDGRGSDLPYPGHMTRRWEAAGRPMPPTVIYEILDRHGWMLGGVFVLPRRVPIPEEYRALHLVSRPRNA